MSKYCSPDPTAFSFAPTINDSNETPGDWYCWLLDEAFQCSASFDSDSDIGGPGVCVTRLWKIVQHTDGGQIFASYVAFAIITLFLAIVKFLTLPESIDRTFLIWIQGEDIKPLRGRVTRPSRIHDSVQGILDPLCDLQILTGIGITIAALSQQATITFYHQSLAYQYWFLTLASLLATNPNVRFATRIEISERRQLLRRWATLLTVALFWPLAFLVYYREYHEWDWLESGRCYRYTPGFDVGIFVLVTLALYIFLLFAQLVYPRASDAIDVAVSWYDEMEKVIMKILHDSSGCMRQEANALITKADIQSLPKLVGSFVLTITCVVIILVSIVLRLLLSLCGLGVSHPIFEALVTLGVFIWSIFSIVDMKSKNEPLFIDAEGESGWGFGQVLPVVLLCSLLFMGVDSVDQVRDKGKGGANNALTNIALTP